MDNPNEHSKGMAYNHFSTFTPSISSPQRAEAYRMLQRALNDDLPPPYGTGVGRQREHQVFYLQDHETGSMYPADGSDITNQSARATSTTPCTHQSPPSVDLTNPADWHPVNRRQRVRKQRVKGAPNRATAVFSIFNKATWGTSMSAAPARLKTPMVKAIGTVAKAPAQPSKASTRPQRANSRVSYSHQLNSPRYRPRAQIPNTTPPPPPRYTLWDSSSVQGTLFVASSRLEHNLEGVFAVHELSMSTPGFGPFVNIGLRRGRQFVGRRHTWSMCEVAPISKKT